MTNRKVRFNKRTLFTWLLLAGFIVLFSPQAITGKFQLLFASAFHWPLNLTRNLMLSAVASQPVGGSAEKAGLPYQNQIANLQARVDEVEKKYQQVAGFRAKHPFEGAKFITANITRATNSELIIDSGQKDGLTDGLFVFGDNGVIGTIAGVTAYTAKVRLITNSLCKLEVKIADKSAILQGDGKNVKIKTLPKTCSVQIGQQVFCQPKPGLLNTPIIIGTVSECRLSENPHLWDITVTPAADISALNSVGIIKY